MVEKVSMDPVLLKEKKIDVQSSLNRSLINFYSVLNSFEESSTDSKKVSLISDSMEKLFTYYSALNETLFKNGYFKEKYDIKSRFLESYSLFGGVSEVLLDFEDRDSFNRGAFSGKINFKDEDNIFFLAKNYVTVVKEKANDMNDVVGLTKDFFQWIRDEAVEESKKSEYNSLVSKTNQLHVELGNYVLGGFNYASSLNSTILDYLHREEDIVGNKNMISALKSAINHVMLYDINSKKNVMNEEYDGFQQTFSFWGRPGTGKSATLDAMMNYALEISNKSEKPLFIENITNSFKSSYYSESSNNLKETLNKSSKGDGIYIYVADDIDTVFHSRKKKGDDREDKANLEALIHFLQGMGSVNKGNYLFISTTNEPLSMDQALMGRLKEGEMEVKGPENSKDYVDLFKIKLSRSINKGYVNVNKWRSIGDLCEKYNFSGRDIRNISKNISSKIYSLENGPKKIHSKNYGDQKEDLDNFYSKRKVSDSLVFELIEETYKNNLKIKEDEKQSKIAELVEDHLLHEEARKRITRINN